MTYTRVAVLCIAGSTLVSVLYLLWGLRIELPREKKKGRTIDRVKYLLRFFIMLVTPVSGPLFFAAAALLNRFVFRGDVDLSDVVFSRDRVISKNRGDEEREKNLVPLEEALAITDRQNRRTLMLNILRGDITHSLSAIADALNNEDTETSHYAASILRDILNDFRAETQALYNEIREADEAPEDEALQKKAAQSAGELLEFMHSVLSQGVFTDMEQRTFVLMMEEAGEALFRREPDSMGAEHYDWLVQLLLDVGEYELCEKWVERARKYHADALSTYMSALRLHFERDEKEQFFATMEELKHSDIVIDHESLEVLRTFM